MKKIELSSNISLSMSGDSYRLIFKKVGANDSTSICLDNELSTRGSYTRDIITSALKSLYEEPVFTQKMFENGELPPVGSTVRIAHFDSSSPKVLEEVSDRTVKVLSHMTDHEGDTQVVFTWVYEAPENGYKETKLHSLVTGYDYFLPLKVKTETQKICDDIISALSKNELLKQRPGLAEEVLENLLESDKFTIAYSGQEDENS